MKSKKPSKENKITKKMSFAEIMQKAPGAAEILMEKGMHCMGCPMAMQETLEQGALAHGLDPDKLIEEINKKLKKK
jgi:hybrid cluster-associated redox disulfide protein